MKANDSAFPWYNPGTGMDSYSETGLSMRQYIAIEAMKALIISCQVQGGTIFDHAETVAQKAVVYADKLIKEL